jgi:hypothetical protein
MGHLFSSVASSRPLRHVGAIVFLVCCATLSYGQAIRTSFAAPIFADELGKGTIPLDGPWQFHLGDNLADFFGVSRLAEKLEDLPLS